MYAGALQLPKWVTDYADNFGVNFVVQDIKEIQVLISVAIWETRSWFEDGGLGLAGHKDEIVLITKERKQISIKIRIGEQSIYSQPICETITGDMDQDHCCHLRISC